MTEKNALNETNSEDVTQTEDNKNFPVADANRHQSKRCGMDFYTKTLGSPKYVVRTSKLYSEMLLMYSAILFSFFVVGVSCTVSGSLIYGTYFVCNPLSLSGGTDGRSE